MPGSCTPYSRPEIFPARSCKAIAAFVLLGVVCLWLAGCGGQSVEPGYRPPKSKPAVESRQDESAARESGRATSKPPAPKPGSGPTRPYTVLGRTYYPMQNAHGYSEEGLASWYGPDFHGKKTASGEVYDMYAMTAAHKILPLQTEARITNLSNGKSTVVRINDRGPFAKERILDLSYAAAKELGVVGPGTALVRLEALSDWNADDPGESFYIQLGAFIEKANAERFRERLSAEGYQYLRLTQGEVRGRMFWKVQIGPFGTLTSAKKGLETASADYPSAFIVAD